MKTPELSDLWWLSWSDDDEVKRLFAASLTEWKA